MGGMGIVYLCHDHEEDRPVALKTFKPEYLPDRATRDRFLREGDTWVRLGRHSHIVRAYRVERVGHGLEVFLVLELVAKEQGRKDASLRSWLTPGQPLPVAQALLFGLQITRGMAQATAAIPGLVHRDLKPENVLVGSDRLSNVDINRLRVTDFGLAGVLLASGQESVAPWAAPCTRC
jgi:serine/threonine protein kinase